MLKKLLFAVKVVLTELIAQCFKRFTKAYA